MSNVDFKRIFEGFDPAAYETEAAQRWGETDAHKISARRAKSYTKADWQRFKHEQSAIFADALHAMKDGIQPS